MLLDYTVQAIDRQSFGKDVKESTQSQAISEVHVAAPFTKKKTKLYHKEIKSVQEPSQELGTQVFESVSEHLTMKATSVRGTETHHATAFLQTSQSTGISTAAVQEMRGAPPRILLKLHDLTVRCGQTAQFICALESEHFSEVLWTHEGERIKESERVKLSQNGSVLLLTILNVQLLDQGIYSCTVYNDHGEATNAAVLTVEGGYLIFNIMTYIISTSLSLHKSSLIF